MEGIAREDWETDFAHKGKRKRIVLHSILSILGFPGNSLDMKLSMIKMHSGTEKWQELGTISSSDSINRLQQVMRPSISP